MGASIRSGAGVSILSLLFTLAPAARAEDIVVHAGHLIDGISTGPQDKVSIFIKGDRITAVQTGFVAPAEATLIDLSNATVLPGLIDCHKHIGGTGLFTGVCKGSRTRGVCTTNLDYVLQSTVYARQVLEEGFTAIRNVGEYVADSDLALKRAINAGLVPGPRMWISLEPLAPTGGHGDPTGMPGLQLIPSLRGVVDGTDAVLRAVRDHHKRGADLIKIMPSGGVLSAGDDPGAQLMTDEEIRTAIEAAHSLGMKVAAHAMSKTAIETSVRLGVDSIEHGTLADEKSFRLLKEHGTFLVPTIIVGVHQMELAATSGLPPEMAAKGAEMRRYKDKGVAQAYRAGIKMRLVRMNVRVSISGSLL